jgi:hypothetical protein
MNLAIVVVGWLVSFAVSFPPVFGMGTYKYIQEESQCTFRHHTYRGNDTLGFLLVNVFANAKRVQDDSPCFHTEPSIMDDRTNGKQKIALDRSETDKLIK